MATTMNISLPDELRAFVEQQVRERAFGSNSEYLRDLIREQRDVEQLRGVLLEGARSPVEGKFDEAWFKDLRDRIAAQAGTKADA